MLLSQPTGDRGFARVPRGSRHRSLVIGRLARTDDSGASLVIALIIITVVAIVVGSVLALSGTNERATVALRDQASDSAAAAGAVQVGINKLRTASNTLVNFGCSPDASSAVSLLDMPYPASGTAPGGTAHVTCTTDIDGSETGFLTQANAGPGSALLSLGTDAGDGILVNDKRNGGSNVVTVDGGVFSNTTLSVPGNPLRSVWQQPAPPNPKPAGWNPMSWMIARNGNTKSASDVSCKNVTIANPTVVYNNCLYGPAADVRGIDPGMLVPAGTTSYNQSAPNPVPAVPTVTASCYTTGTGNNQVWVVEVKPSGGAALINDAAVTLINSKLAPTGCGNKSATLIHFAEGIYYVTAAWGVPATYIVAGKMNPSYGTPTNYYNVQTAIDSYYFGTGNPPGTLDNWSVCVDPTSASATTSSGVEFFVAAGGQLNINSSNNQYKSNGTQMVICASKSDSGPPMAIYSPRTAGGSDAITTANCPSCGLTLQGTVYSPARPVDIFMNNGSSKQFAYGIFAKSINATVNSSSKASGPLSMAGGIPEGGGSPIPIYVFYLTAYVCPGQGSCDASGRVALTAKVRVSGYIQRTVTVLSWSTSR